MDAEAQRRSLEGERDEGVQLHGEKEVDRMDSTVADEEIVGRRRMNSHFERRRTNRRTMAIKRRESEERREGGEKRSEMLVCHIDPHVRKREIEEQNASTREEKKKGIRWQSMVLHGIENKTQSDRLFGAAVLVGDLNNGFFRR